MGKLNFTVSFKLIADKLKSGIKATKQGFDNLASSAARSASKVGDSLRAAKGELYSFIGMMGFGALSIGGFVSKLVQTARELGRARTALKNASASAAEFSGNMRYLRELSKDYGQDIATVTDAYARFTAAARQAGLSVQSQQGIFTATTRAIAAFQLSGQEAQLTFYALSQMMSKGKVSSEELRRQLGERIPIAIEAMKRALGTDGAGLDKMLKEGKISTKDILPKWGEELQKMLPDVDLDNLETSMNRLGNTFAQLTDKLDIYQTFKQSIDKVEGLLKGFVDGSISLLGVLGAAFGALFGKRITSGAVNLFGRLSGVANAERNRLKTELAAAQEELAAHSTKVKTLLQQATATDVAYQKAKNAAAIASPNRDREIADLKAKNAEVRRLTRSSRELLEAKMRLSSARAERKSVLRAFNKGDYKGDFQAFNQQLKDAEQAVATSEQEITRIKQAERDRRAQQIASNNQKIKQLERERDNESKNLSRLAAAREKQSIRAKEQGEKRKSAIVRVAAAEQALSVERSTGMMNKAYRVMGAVAKSVWNGIKSLASAMLWSAALGAVFTIVEKISEAARKARELANLSNTIAAEYDKAINTQEILTLKTLMKEVDTNGAHAATSMETLREKLGSQTKDWAALRSEVEKYIQALQAAAGADFSASKIKQLDDELKQINDRRKSEGKKEITEQDVIDYRNFRKLVAEEGSSHQEAMSFSTPDGRAQDRFKKKYGREYKSAPDRFSFSDLWGSGDYSQWIDDISQYSAKSKAIEEEKKRLLENEGAKRTNPVTKANEPKADDDGNTAKRNIADELNKISERFNQGIKYIENNKRYGDAGKQIEFDKQARKLATETQENLIGLLGAKAKNNPTYQNAQKHINDTRNIEIDKAEEEYARILSELTSKYGEQAEQDKAFMAEKHKATEKLLEVYNEQAEKDPLVELNQQRIDELQQAIAQTGQISQMQADYNKEVAQTKEEFNRLGRSAQELANTLSLLAQKKATELEKAPASGEKETSIKAAFGSQLEADKQQFQVPDLNPREDEHMDYTKKKSEILEARVSQLEEKLKLLEPHAKAGNQKAIEAYKNSKNSLSDLKRERNKTQIDEDVDSKRKKKNKLLYSGSKQAAQDLRQFAGAVKELDDALKKPDATELERVFALFDASMNIVNAVEGIVGAVMQLAEAVGLLKKAKEAQSQAETQATAQTVANASTEVAAKTTVATAAVAANNAEAATATTAAAAQAAKAHAGIPFAGVALAAGAVATIVGLISAAAGKIPKFANGGIVPGAPSNGDRVLARLNPGELILNQAQQANLAGRLQNNAPQKVQVQVSGRLRGQDLLLSHTRAERRKAR